MPLEKIASTSLFDLDGDQGTPSFADILQIYSLIDDHGNSTLHRSIQSVLVRILECSILQHPDLLIIADRWETFVGRSHSLISDAIEKQVGVIPPDQLIKYIARILGGTAMQVGRNAPYKQHVIDVFDRHLKESRNEEFRCDICGYHFSPNDMGKTRRNIATSLGFQLNQSGPHPKRIFDQWKPLHAPGKSNGETPRPYTELSLDHIIPQEGLGWSGEDNLVPICRYCNLGKMTHKWALEPLSTFANGGVSNLPEQGKRFNAHIHTIAVAKIRHTAGSCELCGKSKKEVELTVKEKENPDLTEANSFSPWSLISTCYECI